jgi:hypothetical protein
MDVSDDPEEEATVTMYCLGAIELFENMDREEIQRIGFEIGMLGTKGIDRSNSKKRYVLKSIPGKEFTGLQLLAYMYVAFQYIDPSLDTGLNFRQSFVTARRMHDGRQEERNPGNN